MSHYVVMVVIPGPVRVGFREKYGISSEVLETFYRRNIMLMQWSLSAGQATAILRHYAERRWEFVVGIGVNVD